jgi:uncharacterized small protein (DUF1192 family)
MTSDDRIEQLVKAVLQAVDARIDPLRTEITQLRAELARIRGEEPQQQAVEFDLDRLSALLQEKLDELLPV